MNKASKELVAKINLSNSSVDFGIYSLETGAELLVTPVAVKAPRKLKDTVRLPADWSWQTHGQFTQE